MRWSRQLQVSIRARWIGYAAALAAVGLVSGLIWLILGRTHIANISMLYLGAVLATAVAFGRGPAILASIASFVTFDLFFTKPYYAFTVADPEEWVALLLFLATAVITGQLAAGQRQRAQEARQREREAVVLYDVARLMSDLDLGQALDAVAERLRQELQLAAVAIEVADGSRLKATRAAAGGSEALRLLPAAATAPTYLLQGGPAPTAVQRGAPGRWISVVPPRPPGAPRTIASDRLYVVPVKVEGRRTGTIVLVRAPDGPGFTAADDRLLSAVSTQLGLALERARLRREATEAEVLRRTDELKTALLNAVSHDLRTPLASIIASAGSLRQEDVSWTRQERREFAETIEQEAQRLNLIIGNVLDLSRMEAGSLRPEKSWYDLGALIDDVLGRLRPVTAQHRVVVESPDELPPVPLDYVEIDQVLSNLVENAARYTPPGTEIRVAARQADGEVQVEVADRGPGIPEAALPHLFEPFYRANRTGPRPKGTGLGLAVARGLVEAHGGHIWAENRPGGGTRFVFTLPLAGPMDGALAAEQAQG
ncbi:MAG: DUF4118 domain-containing protein [Chloroflexi bacterium]|nr:DUF4118 domain-containing protein [Chloroflexota bacterium]